MSDTPNITEFCKRCGASLISHKPYKLVEGKYKNYCETCYWKLMEEKGRKEQ